MVALFYIQLIALTAGTLVYLFIPALILGYRRPRTFERMLFFLVLCVFLAYAGELLLQNSWIHYAVPPHPTVVFAMILTSVGLGFLPGLVVWCATEFGSAHGYWRPSSLLRLLVFLLLIPAPEIEMWWVYLGSHAVPSASVPAELSSPVYLLRGALALVAAVLCIERSRRRARTQIERGALRTLQISLSMDAGLLTALLPWSSSWLIPGTALAIEPLFIALTVSAVIPGAALIYYMLRHNFLQMARQKTVVYAVSATFLGLLYLAFVRRIGGWLEPVLPPEATAAILLFALVALYEPLRHRVGKALEGSFKSHVDRLQRLIAEIQQETRKGDAGALVKFCERRIQQEFGLHKLAIRLKESAEIRQSSDAPGAEVFPLQAGGHTIGWLEAGPEGAPIGGDVHAALEFLAEQLPAAIAVAKLIEEKLQLERELAERERLALVGQMTASLSHNLRNPLSSMKTLLQVQLEKGELPIDLRRDCALVVSEIDRLSAKLTQLLKYAKPSVRLGAGSSTVEVAAVVERVAGLLRHDAERRGIRLELERPAAELRVAGDEEALHDIVTNLVVNAIEALERRGTVRIRMAEQQGSVLVEVTDNGPGIPASLREKLFVPFFTTKPSGTGLGLAIVEKRVTELCGTISCERPPEGGAGTRFTVKIPAAKEAR